VDHFAGRWINNNAGSVVLDEAWTRLLFDGAATRGQRHAALCAREVGTTRAVGED
jgi:hypothetical protein